MQSLSRVIGIWVLVMVTTAVVLSALDRVPGLLAGTPHRARVYPGLEEAERALGARIWLPAFYPEDLRWPPSRVEASASAPTTVLVRVRAREGGGEKLVVAQCLGCFDEPPTDLLPPGRVLGTSEVRVGTNAARLVRLLVGTREVHDLAWDQGGRRITLRYAGPVQQVLLMAGSMERLHQ